MIFIGNSQRSSGQIRGLQIVEFLRRSQAADFVESGSFNVGNVKDRTSIFIRSLDRNQAAFLKQRGCKVVFDILDRPVADIHECLRTGNSFSWSRYNIPEVDEFIVNNDLIKKELELATGKMCTIIPHHAVGSSDRCKKSIRTAGYIGLVDQLDRKEQIEKVCKKFGIDFISENPETREGCIRALEKIDLGIINLEKSDRSGPVLKYKPNTKLTNFQSFGIPTISVPYSSFSEFGAGAWVSTQDADFLQSLEQFLDSSNLQERVAEISRDSIANSKQFTLESISEIYGKINEK
jgi:hypothetical protein